MRLLKSLKLILGKQRLPDKSPLWNSPQMLLVNSGGGGGTNRQHCLGAEQPQRFSKGAKLDEILLLICAQMYPVTPSVGADPLVCEPENLPKNNNKKKEKAALM